jgi:hypothetical protein
VRVRDAETWGVAHGADPEGALRFRRDGSAVEERLHSGEILDFRR